MRLYFQFAECTKMHDFFCTECTKTHEGLSLVRFCLLLYLIIEPNGAGDKYNNKVKKI